PRGRAAPTWLSGLGLWACQEWVLPCISATEYNRAHERHASRSGQAGVGRSPRRRAFGQAELEVRRGTGRNQRSLQLQRTARQAGSHPELLVETGPQRDRTAVEAGGGLVGRAGSAPAAGPEPAAANARTGGRAKKGCRGSPEMAAVALNGPHEGVPQVLRGR